MDISYIMKAIGRTMLVALPLMSAYAAPLTPEEALVRIQGSVPMSRMPGNVAGFQLAHTETSCNNPMIYVFNRGTQGFVIASADDSMPALLGYSDCGAFDVASASPELKWWLGQYADEAAFCLEKGIVPSASAVSNAPSRVDRADIPELLATKWNQDAPYNLDCPEDLHGRCVTGCIATAMAQIIKYHAYPVQGSGQHSYDWNGQTLSFDYETAVFNYSDMLDVYDWAATPEQQKAVAALLYACGVSVNMNYSSVESSASDMYIPNALKTFFNYDAGTRLLKRNCFTVEQWEDMVYEELAAGRPVIYGGQAANGGHQFVCDGYENGYFHINWGWAGMGNGYFLLSALDPGLQGIGGFSGGYNTDQTMIAGAMPNKGGEPWYPIYSTASMVVTDVYNNSQAMVNFRDGGFYNFSPEPVTLKFHLKAVSESGSEFVGETPLELQFGGAVGNNVTGYSGIPIALPLNLAPGEYKASLVFQTPEGNWQDLLFPLSQTSYANLSVSQDGTYSFSEGSPAVKAKIKMTAFAPQSTVLAGVPVMFNLTVENVGEIEFSNVITLKVFEKDSRTQELAENRIKLDVAAGETFNGYVNLSFDLADGVYDVIAFDPYGDEVSDVFILSVGEVPVEVERIILDVTDTGMEVEGQLQLTATVLPEDASDKSLVWTSSDPEIANVDQDGLVTAFTPGTAIITVESAANEEISASCQVTVRPKVIYVASVTLDQTEVSVEEGASITLVATVLPEDATDRTLYWTSSDEEVAVVDHPGVVTVLKAGTAVITAASIDGSDIKAECTIIGVTGVDEILTGEAKADVYTVGGLLLKAGADSGYVSNLASGTYILRIGTQTYKIIR